MPAPLMSSGTMPFQTGHQGLHSVWQAPLVPVALAITTGIVADRWTFISFWSSLLLSLVFLAAWFFTHLGTKRGLALFYLWTGMAALSAGYHHWRTEIVSPDDISSFAADEPRLVLLRGVVHSEPTISRPPPRNPLRGYADTESTRAILRVGYLKEAGVWRPVSGLVQMSVSGAITNIHLGDEVEVAGRLALPSGPANPGEFDRASYLRDQGIRAVVTVRNTAAAVVILQSGPPKTLAAGLAAVAEWARRVFDDYLSDQQNRLARALLLGDGSAMTGDDWDKYLCTGVIHVLAISGQHLVVLGWFFWSILRLLGISRRQGALVVAGLLMFYALLVGARPPVMRAAWTVTAACGGLYLRRPTLPANSFALAWILVALWNPADIFNTGCLLSFLAVAILLWGTGNWNQQEIDPLAQLIETSRPAWQQAVRALGRTILLSYAVNLAVWLAVTPLAASRFHLVSPIALLIGPPMVLLTSIALISGFCLLFLAPLWLLAAPAAGITWLSLTLCEWLVEVAMNVAGAYWYVPDLPFWWLAVFYVGLLAGLVVPYLRQRPYFSILAGVGWLCLGLIASLLPGTREFRCTFLAVGHGGCTVIETPDGRTLLYDAGAMTGPEVTRRQIAPFLWQRGIRRVDELFLSHADLDHFNGVPALAERFAIGQVTTTPSFLGRDTTGVDATLQAFKRHGIAVRVTRAGDRFEAGPILIHVLHPPPLGPEGNENARSMVLLVRHHRHTILLTGDLEGPGLDQVLALPPQSVDILMAPHHGSPGANTPALAAWARAKIVISSQGKPRSATPTEPYTAIGAQYLATWPHGAITIREDTRGLVVETYRTGRKFLVD
jgi:competence protein ComEC